jgi:hypothetical protein
MHRVKVHPLLLYLLCTSYSQRACFLPHRSLLTAGRTSAYTATARALL